MKFSLKDIIEATGAKVLKDETKGDEKFTFSTDTRTIQNGQIYLPLKGENFDGEKFIDKALEAGAVGYFCTNYPSPQPSPARGEGGNPKLILQVEDTLFAYLQLARFCRRGVNGKIAPKTVAITGSSGKTTTKEMAYCVANEKFRTHKSELNFNNEIGLCKTILAMPKDTEVLILEMGMRGPGEIELLSKYAEPDIAIIANVGTAHIGRLGSRENIAKAKCEIVKHLKEDGLLIFHDEDLIKQTIQPFNLSTVRPFNLNNAKITERKVGYTKFEYKNHVYELSIEGDYNVQNALATIEMGLALKMTEEQIASGLKKYSPIEKRWDVEEIGGFKIINDSYNANPESMKAAINTFIELYQPPLLLVLGDMGELGENEAEYHKQIGEFLLKKLNAIICNCEEGVNISDFCNSSTCHCEEGQSPDAAIQNNNELGLLRSARNDANGVDVITVGKLSNEITKILQANRLGSTNFENNLQTARYILDNTKFGTTIILKASRSMKLEEIIEEIKSKKTR